MVVAVNANTLTGKGRGCGGDGTRAGEEFDAAAEYECGVVGSRFGELGHAALESVEGERDLCVDAIGVGDQIGCGEVFRHEGGVASRGGEREMHLCGATAQQRGSFEIETGVFACECG